MKERTLNGIPLSRDTVDALVILLASTTRAAANPSRDKIDWTKIESEDGRLITPEQLKLYRGEAGASTAGGRESTALDNLLNEISRELWRAEAAVKAKRSEK